MLKQEENEKSIKRKLEMFLKKIEMKNGIDY